MDRYETANDNGILDYYYKKLETGIKDKSSGQMLVYTKGFRASSKIKRSNLKGESDIDIAIIEEFEDIRDPEIFSTFADSIRKKGSLIIVMLNSPDIQHWLIKQYFNLEQAYNDDGTIADGYWKLIPKKLKGFVCIQTTFEDNPYLSEQVIDRYKGYGDPLAPHYNYHYYMTAIKGFSSSGRKGQVLRKVKSIKLADYMKLPYPEIYGQDFGTAAPAGLIGCKFHKNTCYARQINYLPLPAIKIGRLYCTLGFTGADRIIYDHADKDASDKLKFGFKPQELEPDDLANYPGMIRGFNMFPAIKDIEYGISIMDGMELYAVEESVNLWEEIMSYVYAQNKSGEYTNNPEDSWNHLIDPWRYVCVDQRGKKEMFGI